jgi:outer membrane protein assembly factor BamB
MPQTADKKEIVYIGSADKHVYALDPDLCEESPGNCYFWANPVTLPDPVTAPLLVTHIGSTNLFVGTTDEQTGQGTLHVIGSQDGNPHWSFTCWNKAHNVSYPLRWAPSVNDTRVFLAYGERIVVLDAINGALITEAEGLKDDPFLSSPVLNDAVDALFVHGASGRLFRYNIAGSGHTTTLSFSWGCHYTTTATDCCHNMMTMCSPPTGVASLSIALSSPALGINDEDIVISTYASTGGTSVGGFYKVLASDGSKVWKFTGTEQMHPGSSRSSPAIDSTGAVFVATQTPTKVLMYAFEPAGDAHGDAVVRWIKDAGIMGSMLNDAGVVLGTNGLGVPRVFLSSLAQIVAYDEGHSCPTTIAIEDCSGHGFCDCTTAQCHCSNACWSGDDCATEQTCSGHGTCGLSVTGAECKCDPCYFGPSCEYMNDCGGKGACAFDPKTNRTSCHCQDPCWVGPSCTLHQKCSGHGYCTSGEGCKCYHEWSGVDCAHKKSEPDDDGLDGGAIAGIIAGVVVLVAIGVVYYLWTTGVLKGGAGYQAVMGWFGKSGKRAAGGRTRLADHPAFGQGTYGATATTDDPTAYIELDQRK